jgi:dihydroflavonol-4-reductase
LNRHIGALLVSQRTPHLRCSEVVRPRIRSAHLWGRPMATPKVTAPRGLIVVTGGSGYIAGYCIAQLLNEGWRARTTVRNLGAAEEVRATIGRIAANAGAIEFMAANLNSDVGWADAVTGADYVLHVASPVPTVDPKSDDELVRPARDGTLRA